jgi:pheromone shutdown protein TraB
MKGLFGAYKTMSPAAATAYTTLGLVQLAMARYTGVTEGSDMVVSITVARSLGCPVALIDKNIQPIIEDIVSTALDASIPDAFRWLSQNVEKRPRASALTELLDSDTVDMNSIDRAMMEFRSVAPYASSRLLDERNEYMATRLWSLKQQGYSVAAVVGAGHVSGMQNLLDEYELNPPAGAVSVPLRVPDVS